jgi:imidazole glycerol-phosphate synthase subunit HisH
MIAIVDYAMGNLRSVEKACESLGMPVQVTDKPEDLAAADGIIMPGVGSFGDAMRTLTETGMAEAVSGAVRDGMPYLGICLGLQLLADVGEEDGEWQGLGLVGGRCVRLPSTVKVPHMGWNQVRYSRPSRLFDGIGEGTDFYFVHSYYLRPSDPSVIIGVVDYGGEVPCAIARDNLFAVQFHPEKSGDVGLRLLRDFASIVSGA